MLLREGPWTHTAQKDLPAISWQSCLAHLWHLLCVWVGVHVRESLRDNVVGEGVGKRVCACLMSRHMHKVCVESMEEKYVVPSGLLFENAIYLNITAGGGTNVAMFLNLKLQRVTCYNT